MLPFNGAATFQLRIAWNKRKVTYAVISPSMEPQLFSCGLKNTQRNPTLSETPSMEPQLFSCGLQHKLKRVDNPQWSFNGAATFQLRIACNATLDIAVLPTLQWSRNFSVADCMQCHSRYCCITDPSMEPQLFSCGLLDNGGWCFSFTSSFNGAATFQLRIADYVWRLCSWFATFNGAATFQLRIVVVVLICVIITISPSMEPQLFSCGL